MFKEKVIVVMLGYDWGLRIVINITCLLLLTFSALVANPKKLLYTVANPARGLLNREKNKKTTVFKCQEEVLHLQPLNTFAWQLRKLYAVY